MFVRRFAPRYQAPKLRVDARFAVVNLIRLRALDRLPRQFEVRVLVLFRFPRRRRERLELQLAVFVNQFAQGLVVRVELKFDFRRRGQLLVAFHRGDPNDEIFTGNGPVMIVRRFRRRAPKRQSVPRFLIPDFIRRRAFERLPSQRKITTLILHRSNKKLRRRIDERRPRAVDPFVKRLVVRVVGDARPFGRFGVDETGRGIGDRDDPKFVSRFLRAVMLIRRFVAAD